MSVDVGTRWYKAPDILYGARQYSSSVDIWSAGCLFAELLDTTPLFAGFNDLDQTAKISHMLGSPCPEKHAQFFA
jgi:serine/threonine protein kinase